MRATATPSPPAHTQLPHDHHPAPSPSGRSPHQHHERRTPPTRRIRIKGTSRRQPANVTSIESAPDSVNTRLGPSSNKRERPAAMDNGPTNSADPQRNYPYLRHRDETKRYATPVQRQGTTDEHPLRDARERLSLPGWEGLFQRRCAAARISRKSRTPCASCSRRPIAVPGSPCRSMRSTTAVQRRRSAPPTSGSTARRPDLRSAITSPNDGSGSADPTRVTLTSMGMTRTIRAIPQPHHSPPCGRARRPPAHRARTQLPDIHGARLWQNHERKNAEVIGAQHICR